MLKRTAFLFFASVLTSAAFAQMAPRETVVFETGGAKVTVEYGRPSLKGRTFDELSAQLPSDRIWRAGSEQITTLTTEAPIMIGGRIVQTGKYSLYVHCAESGAYSLVLNTALGQPLKSIWSEAPPNLANEPWPHMNYQEIQNSEAARIPLTKATLSSPIDLFTITLEEQPGGARLSLIWGDQNWSTDVKRARAEGSRREGS